MYEALNLDNVDWTLGTPANNGAGRFKLPIFEGKDLDNFDSWLLTAKSCLHLTKVGKHLWVWEVANYLKGLAE